ncbi:DUF1302 domain-containing protein [Aquipseudomonas alcaligenes]|uniref:DUF1302 domain-containing protein n=1 Tax=Aquipseudomonas alcaligenes TaxID=43263 RepID=A0A1N6NPJ3_AQUAC|nr:DUF1302 domain-containing protein [Pseudomonas alcaligenes]SIP93937.1 Protein of unknown function [Pseudomonas alcaligenes]
MTSTTKIFTPRRLTLALLLATGAGSLPAMAFTFGGEGERVWGSFDSTLSYGLSQRLQSRDCSIIGNDSGGCNPGVDNELSRYYNLASGTGYANVDNNYSNADDGDLNYNKHDVFSHVLKGIHELSLKFDDDWSALGRVSWLKDFKMDNTRDVSLDEDARDAATQRIDLLDLWVAKGFEVGNMPAKIKVGNQVISWGEEIFFSGGINQINAFNLTKFNTPGTQVKEVFIPAQMVSFNIGLTESLSLESYYQLKWREYELNAAGTYFSSADVVGEGNRPIYLSTSVIEGVRGAGFCSLVTPTGNCGSPRVSGLTDAQMVALGLAIPYAGKDRPSDGGQYGIALRWMADSIDTEFGLFYQRYHEKTPFVGYSGDRAGNVTDYFLSYGEDRDLYGLSMNTMLGPVAVGAELSYRPEDSVSVDPTVSFGSIMGGSFDENSVYDVGRHPGYVTEKKWQFDVNATYSFSASDPLGFIPETLGADDAVLIGEILSVRYPGLETDGSVPYLLTDYSLPDRAAWAYIVEFAMNYQDAFGTGATLTPQLDFSHEVEGTSPNGMQVEGRKSLTASLFLNYQSRWKGGLQWVNYWGGGSLAGLKDRDFVSASLSYSF